MITVADQTKENTSLLIDGIRFVRVHFINCQLIYQARDEMDFEDCTFEQVSWTFDEAAERTIAFLATLNTKTGPEGSALVDGIVKSIKNRKVIQLRTAIAVGAAHPPAVISS